eukprot:CAMPEP_0176141018 /NCGR_PEP_ID=MMETSP0120_2-20121206/71697_1 /TAXON_ID=160619 /ORGANISM="Kryptoperidinium foliaceum, Strain CCMP 1326" /LENGTH=44 /DNA_ID= /DNA_START= /DNA_END= /DNA_ORIENTATION=
MDLGLVVLSVAELASMPLLATEEEVKDARIAEAQVVQVRVAPDA